MKNFPRCKAQFFVVVHGIVNRETVSHVARLTDKLKIERFRFWVATHRWRQHRDGTGELISVQKNICGKINEKTSFGVHKCRQILLLAAISFEMKMVSRGKDCDRNRNYLLASTDKNTKFTISVWCCQRFPLYNTFPSSARIAKSKMTCYCSLRTIDVHGRVMRHMRNTTEMSPSVKFSRNSIIPEFRWFKRIFFSANIEYSKYNVESQSATIYAHSVDEKCV